MSDIEIEFETFLDDFLERDERGSPRVLTLETALVMKVRRDNGPMHDKEVGSLEFHRPKAEDLDLLEKVDGRNAFKPMREFIARLTDVEYRHICKLDGFDFYRAMECAKAFLPKPKPKGESLSNE